MATVTDRATGAPLVRVEGREKVTGRARYAVEMPVEGAAYGWIVQSDVARGEVRSFDLTDAFAVPGVLLVMTHENAPRLEQGDDAELQVLQSARVAYRGQIVAAVVAETLEAAREAAGRVRVEIAAEQHDAQLRTDHPSLYAPDTVNAGYATDTAVGDFDRGFAEAEVQVDVTYETPAFHNNPMEPHATLARWDDSGALTLYDSNQGASAHRATAAQILGLEADQVRVVSEHVGGGFGSKGTPRPNPILAAMLARAAGRPVKLPVTRQQMFALTGYRTPTIQRLRLGASAGGRIDAIAHDAYSQSSTLQEFAEQTAAVTRSMYAGPNRRTTHRLARLDVPTPSWMRAPGECPGMYGLESAMDELAAAAGVDPVELRILNEPDVEPEGGKPFSSRNLVACLRAGAERFGWAERDPAPGIRRDGRWLTGTGMASAAYPAMMRPAQAIARVEPTGAFLVRIGAADIGTGARTVLTQLAADELGIEPARVHVAIGDSALPPGPVAGGSAGTSSWGSAVVKACRLLRAELDRRGGAPGVDGLEVAADTQEDVDAQSAKARLAFGAQFVEVRVDVDTGEVRVARMLGVFAAGRIINPMTARSQLIGGMTMGIGMALHEESVVDPLFGDYLNHDFAQYHVPVNADIPDIEAHTLEEHDDDVNLIGTKGIGEIGIVGAAAAVGNAIWHATGERFRRLPVTPDKVLESLGR